MNDYVTCQAVFADVQKNIIPFDFANYYARYKETARDYGKSALLPDLI